MHFLCVLCFAVPEQEHRTIGLGIKHGEPGHERYYKTEVTLDDTEDDNEKLLAAATSFVEKYFEGKLKPEVTEINSF